MPDRFSLRRNSTSDDWRRDAGEPGAPGPEKSRRTPNVFIVASVICFFLAAVVAAISLFALITADDGSDRPSGLFLGDDIAGAARETPVAAPLSLLLWSQAETAWTSNLQDNDEQYFEGETIPFIASWDTQNGASYDFELTYDCRSGDAQAIDYLTDADSWGEEILEASGATEGATPDATVRIPDTGQFSGDDNSTGSLMIYGATSVPPETIVPSGDCSGRRTLTVPLAATSGEIIVIGAAHLATAAVYGEGKGASSAAQQFGLDLTVGQESASATISPGVVSAR